MATYEIFEYEEAVCDCGPDETVLPVYDGYEIVSWGEFKRRAYDVALDLYGPGWRYGDRDVMINDFCQQTDQQPNEAINQWAEAVCEWLRKIEEDDWQ